LGDEDIVVPDLTGVPALRDVDLMIRVIGPRRYDLSI
jgi:hypothetical protein